MSASAFGADEAPAQSDGPNTASELQARDLARSVEMVRRQTLAQANARVEALEQKARDLARFVETTRQQTQLQSDRKTEALEQKARHLANFVESLRNQTRLQSEAEIETLGQQARDLAVSVEALRKETRLRSEAEIETLGQQARDLARFVEAVREETLQNSATEIATLGRQARDLAVCVETEREQTLLHSDTEIEGLKQEARDVAVSVEESRLETLMESDRAIRKLNEELEQRVLDRTAELEAANKELDSFSYSVSHDLRAPLRAIDGFSRILLDDFADALPDAGKKYLHLVRDNTAQMGRLVDDLLAFSRLGRLALTKQTVHPGTLVRQCLAEMQAEQAGRQVEIVVGDLAPCLADPTLLKQVWTNLLSNALKYTRKCAAAHITVGCRTAAGPAGRPETVYFVEDNGAGFNMKYVDKLFGVFQRLHRAADYEGTGVGLAIVQRIVALHGGRAWAVGRPNEGATFSFTLE